jgi:hypothetical protein
MLLLAPTVTSAQLIERDVPIVEAAAFFLTGDPTPKVKGTTVVTRNGKAIFAPTESEPCKIALIESDTAKTLFVFDFRKLNADPTVRNVTFITVHGDPAVCEMTLSDFSSANFRPENVVSQRCSKEATFTVVGNVGRVLWAFDYIQRRYCRGLPALPRYVDPY